MSRGVLAVSVPLRTDWGAHRGIRSSRRRDALPKRPRPINRAALDLFVTERRLPAGLVGFKEG